MNEPTRRGLLKNAAKAAVAVGGGAVLAASAQAQASGKLTKKRHPKGEPGKKALFSPAVSYGNLLFLSGVGAHFKGTIEQHTQYVLDQIKQTLESSGSSLEKALKVSVFLNSIDDYDAMNKVYAQAGWGDIPPVRTTVSPAGGIPGHSLVEIDVIAYI
jgi:2-iminobutanoate/2-iminopropanoate deaminase